MAGDHGGAHDGLVTHNGHQTAANFELCQQALRHFGHRTTQNNDIKRGFRRGAFGAIKHANFDVGDAGFLQVGARHVCQGGVDFQRNHPLGLLRQQGRHVARTRTDFEHFLLGLDGRVLQQARFQTRCQHGLAVTQWNFHVGKRQSLVRQRHKVFTFDHRQKAQHLGIQHVPRTNLLFDHVETGLFKIHGCTPGGMLTDRRNAPDFTRQCQCFRGLWRWARPREGGRHAGH